MKEIMCEICGVVRKLYRHPKGGVRCAKCYWKK